MKNQLQFNEQVSLSIKETRRRWSAAETGSGKTLAFLIPVLNYILSIDENYLKYEKYQMNRWG